MSFIDLFLFTYLLLLLNLFTYITYTYTNVPEDQRKSAHCCLSISSQVACKTPYIHTHHIYTTTVQRNAYILSI